MFAAVAAWAIVAGVAACGRDRKHDASNPGTPSASNASSANGSSANAPPSVQGKAVPVAGRSAAGTDSAAGEVVTVSNAANFDTTSETEVHGRWITDANALSLLAMLNSRQIAAANIELQAWHSDSVRAFAAAVARQHSDLQHTVDSLGGAINVVPVAPALAAEVGAQMQALADTLAAARGMGLDRAFVREQLSSLPLYADYALHLSSVAQRPEVQSVMATAATRAGALLVRARTMQASFAVADSAAADSAARRAQRRKR